MSFASNIKDEVVRIRVRDAGVKLAELAGLTFACGNLKLGRRKAVSYRTENREVGRHIAALGRKLVVGDDPFDLLLGAAVARCLRDKPLYRFALGDKDIGL